MVRPVTAAKVKLTLVHVAEDKAPGPNGYTSAFYKAAWPIVGSQITQPTQAFVSGHSISDNILLAQKLFTGYNQQRLPPCCALKVDIHKAYDIVDWDFLLAALQLFGFPHRFICWIEECVTTPSFSIRINRTPNGFFVGVKAFGKCEPLRLGQLGFADNLLLLSRAKVESVQLLKRELDYFLDMFGFRGSPQKSHLILSRGGQGIREQLLEVFHFPEGLLSLKYLGLPLISSEVTIVCKPLLTKLDQRIKGWESISLSYVGRLQIIKSILTALNVYWASAFILPNDVIREVE
ncbi:uncharacterized protein LOC105161208 [Sesamum indicum]|uniref:Uncharacterized protein LOC105161208 n=1 Tax=Sesamum indicum TaxID=4182 RepID=A0A6I9T0Z4_SESIN|nr:uncharacterized protein LOC105161208 [Sesamum indicum]